MITHVLKTWPPYFKALIDGTKTFEIRKDARGFAVGDLLLLREFIADPFDDGPGTFTDRIAVAVVTYKLDDSSRFAGMLSKGTCVLGIGRATLIPKGVQRGGYGYVGESMHSAPTAAGQQLIDALRIAKSVIEQNGLERCKIAGNGLSVGEVIARALSPG